MAQVRAHSIKKTFDDVPAVDDVTLSVEDGEFMVLLGPSGCGKSTFLRMVAGLERPTSGDIVIGGRVVNEIPPRARGVAMVFQSYGLYPHMKVRDNIAFPLKTLRVPRPEIERKVAWASRLLNIDRLLDRKPRALSGGERQRVALARALVREPSVFLLDEPLSNLDAKLRTSARSELKQFQRSIGTTTIYVTHDQVEAMGMGDRIAVLERGKIRQVGTPSEIYDRPMSVFVATFLGTPPMNLIERNGIILGFRPESYLPPELHEGHSELTELAFRIKRIEYLGSERIAYGTLDGESSRGEVTSKLPAHAVNSRVREGERCVFSIRKSELHYFDKRDGSRLSRG